ncbi:LOW QUALITY PROTEIN: zinc finger C2HC domain-containing protein 1C-like [Pecten maximus]|uniref:LOW QUALITY PROTEIN: zinc finger C2HC domain-containing protein 1C-like n=1 Tax=Pecten maximus TaxID=6579 RepID=UPI0014582C49|nr:LOW QUALITY PROTEIN: zinc finger C2HC domain-containing protein 1C-like [Pecten maximus]
MISSSVVDRSPVYGGSSNYQKIDYSNSAKRTNMDGGQPKMSRLQLMQMQYQQRMLKDKEEKLVNMYQENQQRAINRVQSKGMAREFFRERREMEANGNLDQMPSIAQHYQQKRRENGVHVNNNSPHGTISRHNSFGSNQSQRQYVGNNRQNSGGHQGYKTRYQKMSSAGRDKSNPLAPIERTNSQENDFFPRKPQIHGRPRTKDSEKRPVREDQMPKSAPINDFSPYDDSPPPNLTNLKNTQRQKVNAFGYGGRPPKGTTSKTTKPSDFQQFQSDRDQERADRLRRHQQTLDRGIVAGYEYEDEKENESEANSQRETAVDIERKQQEIMDKIARQQAELERIRKQRASEEEEEKRERERRKKREEERRKKMKEDEEKRRKEERERREMEEEAKRKSEQQRKTNKSRSRYDNQYQDNGSEGYASNMSSFRAEPTPPPQPKPARKAIIRRPPPQQNPLAMSSDSAHDNKPINSARGGNLSIFEQAARMEGAFDTDHVKQVKCSNCGRKFNADRIGKHREFCGNITKKRKVLDGTKMRVQGTELEKYVGKNGSPKRSAPSGKKGNWRKQHEEFVNNIRYARKVAQVQKEGGSLNSLPPPPPAENADYVQCPHCNRRYNETAAERHIPKCKDIKARPTALKRRR